MVKRVLIHLSEVNDQIKRVFMYAFPQASLITLTNSSKDVRSPIDAP